MTTAPKAHSAPINGMADVQADPALAPFAAEFKQAFARKGQVPYSKSYLLAQQFFISRELAALRRRSPELPLKQAVTHALDAVPDNLSPKLLLEITRFIIETWESIPEELQEPTTESSLASQDLALV